jgi:hypothetical protein
MKKIVAWTVIALGLVSLSGAARAATTSAPSLNLSTALVGDGSSDLFKATVAGTTTALTLGSLLTPPSSKVSVGDVLASLSQNQNSQGDDDQGGKVGAGWIGAGGDWNGPSLIRPIFAHPIPEARTILLYAFGACLVSWAAYRSRRAVSHP